MKTSIRPFLFLLFSLLSSTIAYCDGFGALIITVQIESRHGKFKSGKYEFKMWLQECEYLLKDNSLLLRCLRENPDIAFVKKFTKIKDGSLVLLQDDIDIKIDQKDIKSVKILKTYRYGGLSIIPVFQASVIDTLCTLNPYHRVNIDTQNGETGTTSYTFYSYSKMVNVKEIHRLCQLYDKYLQSEYYLMTTPPIENDNDYQLDGQKEEKRKEEQRKRLALYRECQKVKEILRHKGIFVFHDRHPC